MVETPKLPKEPKMPKLDEAKLNQVKPSELIKPRIPRWRPPKLLIKPRRSRWRWR